MRKKPVKKKKKKKEQGKFAHGKRYQQKAGNPNPPKKKLSESKEYKSKASKESLAHRINLTKGTIKKIDYNELDPRTIKAHEKAVKMNKERTKKKKEEKGYYKNLIKDSIIKGIAEANIPYDIGKKIWKDLRILEQESPEQTKKRKEIEKQLDTLTAVGNIVGAAGAGVGTLITGGAGAGASGAAATTGEGVLSSGANIAGGGAVPAGKTAAKLAIGKSSKGVLGKIFGIAGLTGMMVLGKWGQAESGEPVSIAMKKAMEEAERTGDWSIYNKAKEIRDRIIYLKKAEKFAMNTPIGAFIGTGLKIKGQIEGAKVMDELAAEKQAQQMAGREPEDEKWARIRREQEEKRKRYGY